MGKIRTKTFGDEVVEEKQKKDDLARAEKKEQKKKLSTALKTSLDSAETVAVEEEGQVEKPKKEKEVVSKSKKPVITKKKVGKKIAHARSSFDPKKSYKIIEAIEILKKTNYVKFPSSVEIHLSVNELGIKGEVNLPHGTGKEVRVAIFDDAVLKQIEAGKIDFDVLIATPSQMPQLAKLAKILGPKGLMPNPKTGTVTENTDAAVKKFTSGVIRFKTEAKFPLIHQRVGKINFEDVQLEENIEIFMKTVGKKNILSAFLSSTMGPGVKLLVD